MESKEIDMLKDRFSALFGDSEPTLALALGKAYADMSRRATGHTDDVKKASFDLLTKVFSSLPQFEDARQFDEWHKTTCNRLKSALTVGSFSGTIGRAQKVVNMAFKYLYYVPDFYEEHKEAYQYCHMTLDGYTLNWYTTDAVPGLKVKEWSKIDNYEEYKEIQENIRMYLNKSAKYEPRIEKLADIKSFELPVVPFEAEFIVWEGEIVRKKYDELIKEIELYFYGSTKSRNKDAGQEIDSWILGDSFSGYLQTVLKEKLSKT